MTEINWYHRIIYPFHSLFSFLNQHWNKIKVLGWNVLRNIRTASSYLKSFSDHFDMKKTRDNLNEKEAFQSLERSSCSWRFQALGFLVTTISSSHIINFFKTFFGQVNIYCIGETSKIEASALLQQFLPSHLKSNSKNTNHLNESCQWSVIKHWLTSSFTMPTSVLIAPTQLFRYIILFEFPATLCICLVIPDRKMACIQNCEVGKEAGPYMLVMISSKGHYKPTALSTSVSPVDLRITYFLVEGFQCFWSMSTILRRVCILLFSYL